MERQIVVIAADRVGLLADISDIAQKAGAEIEEMSTDVIDGKSICRIEAKKLGRAKEALEKAGYKTFESDVLIATLKDSPGEVSRLARTLADSRINIENMHLVLKAKGKAVYALRVSNMPEAERIIREFGGC
jgi:hypothetical protein